MGKGGTLGQLIGNDLSCSFIVTHAIELFKITLMSSKPTEASSGATGNVKAGERGTAGRGYTGTMHFSENVLIQPPCDAYGVSILVCNLHSQCKTCACCWGTMAHCPIVTPLKCPTVPHLKIKSNSR